MLARQAPAVVRLQAATRGLLSRRQVQAMRVEQERATAQLQAAVRLQAAAHSLLVRRRLREMRKGKRHQVIEATSSSSVHVNLGISVRWQWQLTSPLASSVPACLPRRRPLPRLRAARRRHCPPQGCLHRTKMIAPGSGVFAASITRLCAFVRIKFGAGLVVGRSGIGLFSFESAHVQLMLVELSWDPGGCASKVVHLQLHGGAYHRGVRN